MPYKVIKDGRCPVSRPYGVVKETDNALMGCHETEGQARAQQAALYSKEVIH